MASVSHIDPLPFCPILLGDDEELPVGATEIDLEDLIALTWRVKTFEWANAPIVGAEAEANPNFEYPPPEGGFFVGEDTIEISEEDLKLKLHNSNNPLFPPPSNETKLVCFGLPNWNSNGKNINYEQISDWSYYNLSENEIERWRFNYSIAGYIRPAIQISNGQIFGQIYLQNNTYYTIPYFDFVFLSYFCQLERYLSIDGGEFEPYDVGSDEGIVVLGSGGWDGSIDESDFNIHQGNLTLNFCDKSLTVPYYYANYNTIDNTEAATIMSVYLNNTKYEGLNDINLGREFLDNVTLNAIEYWEYDPNDGGGPIYNSATGEQLRSF